MPVEVIMPKVDMDMERGTIAVWHAEEGEIVAKGQALFDIETDKATMEVESPASGVLAHVGAAPGDSVAIGGVVAWIYAETETVGPRPGAAAAPEAEAAAPAAADAPHPAPAAAPAPAAPAAGGLRATPLARRLARQSGLALERIAGTGIRGRITRADVEGALAAPAAPEPAAAAAPAGPDPRLLADRLGLGHEVVALDRMRRVISRRLTESKASVPHFYLETDCRLDRLLKLREKVNDELHAAGATSKISVNDFLVRAAALALREVPEANAAWAGDAVLRYAEAHVSVAVSVEGGLMTPVIRRACTKSLREISDEVRDLAARARAGKLPAEASQGGSFSISNLGMFGVRRFSAILNPPEAMILAVGRAETRFVPGKRNRPKAATMMSVTLSCDHRVVDGALGARWLEAFRRRVESPVSLLI